MQDKQPLVLIVDDSRTMRMLLREALENSGFAVIEAESGEQAILLFSQNYPDAILLDVEMRGLDGFSTCLEIRRQAGGQHVPIMMVTSLNDFVSINKAYDVGATDFENKPLNWDLIGHRVRYMIRTSMDFQELQKSKIRLMNAQQLAQLGTWDWDIKKNEVFWSDDLVKITGKTVTKFNTARDHLIDIVHPEDKKMVEDAVNKCIKYKALYTLEYRIITDGNTLFLHEKTDILYDRNNSPVGIFGTIQDITQLKLAEQEIRELNAELEQRVINRTEQLKKANEELEMTLQSLRETQDQLIESEKMAALGNMVAGIANEINTPIGMGVSTVSDLKTKLETIGVAYQNNVLKKSELENFIKTSNETILALQVQLNRASELIKNFRQVSASRSDEKAREINLKKHLQEIVANLQLELKKHPISVVINCPENLMITTYPGAIFQIITILIMNSIQHAFPDFSKGILYLDVTEQEEKINLRYSDNGKGIEEENLKKIFEPFFTTIRGQGGVGLGLHIVYNLVAQKLHGTIDAKSKINEGVIFTIKFPKKIKENTE